MKYQSQEDYLKAIYLIAEKKQNKEVRSVDIADQLKVSKAAVSRMLKVLRLQGFVFIELYSRVTLTENGFIIAQRLTYKNRIIEVFLNDILGVDKENLQKEAHNLEHAFSSETINKLNNFLHKPKFCPCGNEIPQIIN